MRRQAIALFFVFAAGFSQGAEAASVTVAVVDSSDKPLANAVVTLVADGNVDQSAAPQLAADATIDQDDETFIPLVTVIRRGCHVVFRNSDQTTHHVYSFSPLRKFEYKIDRGQKTPPVDFEQSGVVAIGCNIHDQMIAYVFVTDNRWTMRTGADGRARFDNVPSGAFHVEGWHPQLSPRAAKPSQALTVAEPAATASLKIPVTVSDMSGMNMHPHRQEY